MPIYEYNGQHYDIDTADPEEAKTKILTHLGESAPTPAAEKSAGDYVKDFGRGLASAVDTGANMVTGLGSYVGYPVGRAFGLNPQEATAAANRVGAPLQNPVGRAFGIENDPAYQNSVANKIVGGIGQGISSVAQPISTVAGLPQQDVEHMLGTGLIAAGPAIPKAAATVAAPIRAGAGVIADTAKGLGSVAMSPIETARGVGKGFFNDTSQPSARMSIGETYIPANVLEQYRAGKITAEQAQSQAQPTTQLPQNAIANTKGMVPFKGQEMRAAGEQIGSEYRNPYKLGAEIAGDYLLGGIPSSIRAANKLYNVGKTAQAYNQLGKAGFSPITPEEATALAPVAPRMNPSIPQQMQQIAAQKVINPTAPVAAAMPTATNAPAIPAFTPPANWTYNPAYRAPTVGTETAPVTPVAPNPLPAPVAETPKPLPTPAEAAIIAQKAKPVKATNLPATEHGKVPVMGNDYYEHYIKGGLTPNELKYSPGTLAEQLYQKVKTDPASLTKEDIQNWYRYDHMEQLTPDFKVSQPSKKNPTPPTEADLVALASKNIAKNLIENYERVQTKTPKGRPELVGKTVEEAKAFDAAAAEKHRQNQLKQELQEKQKQNIIDKQKAAEKPKKTTAKKAPPGVSNMISGDAASTFNKLKLPQGASELEQKAASMPQEHRSKLISVLKDQLNNPEIDTAAKDLIQAQISMMEKYNIK